MGVFGSGCQAGFPPGQGLRKSSALGPHPAPSRPGAAGSGTARPRRGTRLPAAPPRTPSRNPLSRHFSSCRPGNRRRQPSVTRGRCSQSRDAPARSILGRKACFLGAGAARLPGGGNEGEVLRCSGRCGSHPAERLPCLPLHDFPFIHSTDSAPGAVPGSQDEPAGLNP